MIIKNSKFVKTKAVVKCCCIILLMQTVLSLLLFSCINQTGDPNHYNNLYDKEFTYCLAFAEKHFFFRDSLPDDASIYPTIDLLYASLNDSHTVYIDSISIDGFLKSLNLESDKIGIGIEIDTVSSGVVIIYVYPSSPADKEELKCGDTILSVNDSSLAGLPLQKINAYLSDITGDTKNMQIKRDTNIFEDSIILEKYALPSVFIDSIDSNTAYIFISAFLDNTCDPEGTAGEFKNALIETGWAQHIILDLYGNPGGMFEQALNTSAILLPEGREIIRTIDWIPIEDSTDSIDGYKKDSVWVTDIAGNFLLRNFYVLISDSTAGAAEVFFSCLFRNGRVLRAYGRKTNGFGKKQMITTTPDSNAAIVTSGITSFNGNGFPPHEIIPYWSNAFLTAIKEIVGDSTEINMQNLIRIAKVRTILKPKEKNLLCGEWIKKRK